MDIFLAGARSVILGARGLPGCFSRLHVWRSVGWWPLSVGARLDRSTENAVDKLGRCFAAEKLGQFNRLVDRGPERHCSIAVQGFIESDAQYVAVNRGHLRQRPQRRPQLNQAIDRGAIGEYAAHELLSVATC